MRWRAGGASQPGSSCTRPRRLPAAEWKSRARRARRRACFLCQTGRTLRRSRQTSDLRHHDVGGRLDGANGTPVAPADRRLLDRRSDPEIVRCRRGLDRVAERPADDPDPWRPAGDLRLRDDRRQRRQERKTAGCAAPSPRRRQRRHPAPARRLHDDGEWRKRAGADLAARLRPDPAQELLRLIRAF